MIRAGSALAIGALLLGASLADAQPRRGREGPAGGNPSAIVAAELAFARLAQDKGQWTAFRATADKDAVMFVPETVNAQAWLKKRADPARAVSWQPYRVFVSCDGSYAASTGPWQRADGTQGTFTTIWRRQKDGKYKWLLDFGSATPIPRPEEVEIEGKVADCPARRGGFARDRNEERRLAGQKAPPIPIPPPQSGEGRSDDGTLRWAWVNGGKDAGEQSLAVHMRYQGADRQILRETAALGAP